MQNRKLIIIAAVVAAIVLWSCICITAFTFFGGQGDYELSEEQEAVVEDFGEPDDFTVMFGEVASEPFDEDGKQAVHRVEYWNYRDSRITVVFRDGRFIRQATLAPLPKGTWTFPRLQPTQVVEEMSPEDLVELIGENPDKAIKADKKTGMKMVTVSFKGQIQAGFENDKLVMLETRPVKTATK